MGPRAFCSPVSTSTGLWCIRPMDRAAAFAPPLKVRARVDTFLLVAGSSLLQQKDRGAWFTPKRVGHNKAVARKNDALHNAPMGMFARKGGGRHSPPHCWRWRYHSGHTHPITLGGLRTRHQAIWQWPDLQGGGLARPTVTLEGTVLPANSHPFPSHHPCLLPSFDTPPKGETGLGYIGFWGGG
jgi:hypothetical protein